MRATLVCPKCGRGDNEIRFIEAFCIECYPLNLKVPESIEIGKCKRCDRMHFKGDWTPYDERKIAEQVISKCRGDFSEATYDLERQVVLFTIRKDTDEIQVERSVPLEIKITICQQCSRISGGYYQGIIQLRGNQDKIQKYADMLTTKLEKKTFIAKTEEKDEGLDLYVGNSKAVVEVITQLGIRALITKKLVGREQGKRLYRTTFAIRL